MGKDHGGGQQLGGPSCLHSTLSENQEEEEEEESRKQISKVGEMRDALPLICVFLPTIYFNFGFRLMYV